MPTHSPSRSNVARIVPPPPPPAALRRPSVPPPVPAHEPSGKRPRVQFASSASRYDSLFDLASGGMGMVRVALARGAEGFTRIVALKTLHQAHRNDATARAMMLDEARIAARIMHPNVVQVFDVHAGDEGLAVAMEYVPGVSVENLLVAARRARTRIPLAVAVRIVTEACAGLHAAHEVRDGSGTPLEIVHRDVTPGNILVSVDGHVKLTDFGIAKARFSEPRTDASTVRGKLRYLSPEQVQSARLDRRTDVFSLAVVLYELTTLEHAFDARDPIAVMRDIGHGKVREPSSHVPGYPEAIARVLRKGLARDTNERYPTAAAFADDLERAWARLGRAADARDVAQFVGSLLHDEIESRRVEVARALDGMPATNPCVMPAATDLDRTTPERDGSAPPSAPANDTIAGAFVAGVTQLEARLRSARPIARWVGIGGAAVIVLSMLVAWASSGPTPFDATMSAAPFTAAVRGAATAERPAPLAVAPAPVAPIQVATIEQAVVRAAAAPAPHAARHAARHARHHRAYRAARHASTPRPF